MSCNIIKSFLIGLHLWYINLVEVQTMPTIAVFVLLTPSYYGLGLKLRQKTYFYIE